MGTNNESNTLPQPTTEEALRWLEAELAEQRYHEGRSGWSQRILLGSFAAMVWLLLDALEQGPTPVEAVLKWIVGVSILLDLVWWSLWPSPWLQSRDATSRRYRLATALEQARIAMSYWAARAIGLGVIAFYVGDQIGHWAHWGALAYFGFIASLSILTVVSSYFAFPMPLTNRASTPVHLVIAVPFYALFTCLAYSYLYTPTLVSAISGIRIGVLIAIIIAILHPILMNIHPSRITDQLVTLRRELLSGARSVESCIQSIEQIVIGMRGTNVIEYYFARLLSSEMRFDEASRDLVTQVTNLTSFAESLVEAGNKPSENVYFVQTCKGAAKHLRQMERLSKTITSRQKSFQRQAYEIKRAEPAVFSLFDRSLVASKLVNAQAEREQRVNTYQRLQASITSLQNMQRKN